MPLPQSWVDALFARLSVRYGAAFLHQYGDADPEAVKADWAEALGGIRGDAIAYALQYLPADRPPTALQFRDACLRAPAPGAPRLAPPRTAPPEGVRDLGARMRARPRNAAQECLDGIARAVSARGGRATDAQHHVATRCLQMPGTTLPAALAADPRFATLVAGAYASPAGQIAPPRDDRQPVDGAVATAAENAASGQEGALPGECRQDGGMATI